MRGRFRHREPVLWALLGLVGAALCIWATPRVFPLFPDNWQVRRSEAVALAVEHLERLGETVGDPYVIAGLRTDRELEERLRLASGPGQTAEELRRSALGRQIVLWEVLLYPRGVATRRCTYCVRISPAGEVTAVEIRTSEETTPDGPEDPALTAEEAGERATETLRLLGLDPARFEPRPQVRRLDRPGRSDLVVRYLDREAALGPEVPHGLELTFAGRRLAAVEPWIDGLERRRTSAAWPEGPLWRLRVWAPYLLFPFIAVAFLRRFHEGQAGVRRARTLGLALLASGALTVILGAGWARLADDVAGATPRQATWLWALQFTLIWVAPMALTGALAWSAGEARWRRLRAPKPAAFTAVLHGRFTNATVGRSALRGTATGLALAALLLLAAARTGGTLATHLFDPLTSGSARPGLSQLGLTLLVVGFTVLSQFFLLAVTVPRLGRPTAAVVVVAISALLFFPPLWFSSDAAGLLAAVAAAAVVVTLLLTCGPLAALLASLTSHLLVLALPWLFTADPFLHLQGALLLTALALPPLAGLRGLAGGEEVPYRWDDVPDHARRIAEQERRLMELRTARGIQRSILPELPPRIGRVEVTHAYRPATEVGGDFYDVTALADGRLALAMGDVAGHGVGSGLVMSMARAALVVQVASDPAVEAVFAALNRTLYRTARKSLLATLCYGLLDPRNGELLFASAGHLCPYRVRPHGSVRALEASGYPLGVREVLEVRPQHASLEPGDLLFLCSDGVVEAQAEAGGEPFGYERLEESLRRHAGNGPPTLLDKVLADLARFTGTARQQDDQTLLLLRLPLNGEAAPGDRA